MEHDHDAPEPMPDPDEILADILARWESEDYYGALCELGAMLASGMED